VAILLGIDIGTTSISALLFDSTPHRVVAHSSRPHNAYLSGLPEGQREQSPLLILKTLGMVLQGLSADSQVLPDSVCVTGQMHGFVLLDHAGEPLSPIITWEDSRISGSPEFTAFEELFRQVTPHDEGSAAGAGYAAANIYYMSARGELPPDPYWICSVQDWLVFEMTGRSIDSPVSDPSCAHSTGFYLTRAGSWNLGLLNALKLDEGWMPELREPGTISGFVSGELASRVEWLTEGIPVCTGMGDNQASFLASVPDKCSTALVNVGTGSQVTVWSDKYHLRPGLDTRPCPGGGYLLVGAPLCGGRAFSLLKNFVTEIGASIFGAEISDDRIYQLLLRSAEYETDLVCRTSFSGSRINPTDRGEFSGISTDNLRIGDFTAAVIHGIAGELHELFLLADRGVQTLVGSGNGIRRNKLLTRSISERFSLTLKLSPIEEEAAFGAALAAGIGISEFSSFDDIAAEVARMSH
jgi:sedoheptulokinase